MAENQSLLPSHREICDRLTQVKQEKRLLEGLLKLSIREQQRQQENERRRQQGGAANG